MHMLLHLRRMARTAGALLMLGAVAGCSRSSAEVGSGFPPAPVTVTEAVNRDVSLYLDEIGRTVAREVVSVRPQVSGPITEIHVADGADVKSGDPLFTIDPRPYQARLSAAEAVLARERAALELARIELDRVADLVSSRAVSRQDYDARKNAVQVADARIQEAEAAVETARLDVEYCSIRSPIDGRVGHRLVDVGNVVDENHPGLLVIQRLDPIYADFTIAEQHLSEVKRHMAQGALAVEVRLPDDPDRPLVGELTFLDNAVQETTGTIKLRATVPNPDRRLWPGQFVRVRLILSILKDAVLVPTTAPQVSAQGTYVFVVSKDSTAEMRPVTLGQRQGDQMVIEQGVQLGERIITSMSPLLMPGGKVQVVTPGAAEGASK